MANFKDPSEINMKNVTVATLALVLNLTDQRIRDMVKEEKLHPVSYQPKITFDLCQAVQDYIRTLKVVETDDGDSMPKAKLDQTRADADLKRAKATKAEIELDEFKGIVHRAEDVEAVTTDLVLAVRVAILSMPSRLSLDLSELNTQRECASRIKQECNTILDELSKYEYDPKEYRRRVREREKMERIEEEEIRAEVVAKSGRKPRRNRKNKQNISESDGED